MMSLDINNESILSFSIIQTMRYPLIYVIIIENEVRFRLNIMMFRRDNKVDLYETKSYGKITYFDRVVPDLCNAHQGVLIFHENFTGWKCVEAFNWLIKHVNPCPAFVINH